MESRYNKQELAEIQESSSGDEEIEEWRNGEGVKYAGSGYSDLGNDGDDDITDDEEKANGSNEENKDDKEEDKEIDDVERLIINNIRQQNRRKSTLPDLMNKYGLKNGNKKSQSKPVQKPRRRKKHNTFNLDDDKEQERKKQKETEKYLQIYEDLYKIRDFYKREYLGALKEKVKKQHSQIKELDEAREQKLQERKDQERQASHRVKRRLEKHEFIHDDSFLRNIPKTELFKIVQLQDRLQKIGRLKTNTDIDDFWKEIQHNPDIYQLYLNKLNMEGASQPSFLQPSNTDEGLDVGEDQGENLQSVGSRSGTVEGKDSWAITQMYHHQHRNTPSSRRRQSVNTLAKQAASDLDRHCPAMEMPDLYCFRLDLGQRPPDPLEMSTNAEVKAKQHQRKKFMRRLHKMHQLALTHGVAANRILYRHADDMEMVFGGPDVQDVIDVDYCMGGRRQTSPPSRRFSPPDQTMFDYSDPVRVDERSYMVSPEETHLPPITPPGLASIRKVHTSPQEEMRSKTAFSHSSSTKARGSRGSRSTKDSMRDAKSAGQVEHMPAIQGPVEALPLTMDEVTGKGKIMEAKCASLFWNNYLKAGKKVPMVTQIG